MTSLAETKTATKDAAEGVDDDGAEDDVAQDDEDDAAQVDNPRSLVALAINTTASKGKATKGKGKATNGKGKATKGKGKATKGKKDKKKKEGALPHLSPLFFFRVQELPCGVFFLLLSPPPQRDELFFVTLYVPPLCHGLWWQHIPGLKRKEKKLPPLWWSLPPPQWGSFLSLYAGMRCNQRP